MLLSCREKALESCFPAWWPSTMGHWPFLCGEIQVDHRMVWVGWDLKAHLVPYLVSALLIVAVTTFERFTFFQHISIYSFFFWRAEVPFLLPPLICICY